MNPVYNWKDLRFRRDWNLGLRMMIKCYMLMNIRNIFNFTNTREISPMLDKLITVSHDTASNDNNNNNNNDNEK